MDTSNSTGGGVLAVDFHANDIVATLAQSVVEDGATIAKSQDFTLDTTGRLSATKNLTAGVSLVEATNHYDRGDDSAAWIDTETLGLGCRGVNQSGGSPQGGPRGEIRFMLRSGCPRIVNYLMPRWCRRN